MPSLLGIVIAVHSFPAKLQTDAFDVCYQHLKTPVAQQLCEKDKPYGWIMESLMAIKKLGCSYFERDALHKQRFIECWPHIFKWLKALLDVRDTYDEGNQYSAVAGEVYTICAAIYPSVFDEDGVIEFAVRAWIGISRPDGEENYTGRALLMCLVWGKRADSLRRRTEKAMAACDIDADDLINKLVSRLLHSTFPSSSRNVLQVITLANVMGNLVSFRSFIGATLKTNVGSCFVAVLRGLLDEQNRSLDHMRAARSVLAVIYGSLLYQTVDYAINITIEGILDLLPKMASSNSESKDLSDLHCSSLASDVLLQLLFCLIFEDMIVTCKEALRRLYTGDYQLKALLNASPKAFRDIWNGFEALLLENTVLSYLFRMGFLPEQGVCANVRAMHSMDAPLLGC